MPPTAKKESSERKLHRQCLNLWKRGLSTLCEVRQSSIHGRGVYACLPIPKGNRIIEYVGEIIGKKESERRGNSQMEHAEKTGDAAVYIFTLDEKNDIDGNFPWNTARLINHSCAPNCEAWIEGRKIFIYALEDIAANEELTFDYGFDVDCYEDHPCRCGRPGCVGFIVSRSQWPELQARLATRNPPNVSKNQA